MMPLLSNNDSKKKNSSDPILKFKESKVDPMKFDMMNKTIKPTSRFAYDPILSSETEPVNLTGAK